MTRRPSTLAWVAVTSAVVVAVAAIAALVLAGPLRTSAVPPAAPADGSAEAGFARDMQTHHAQAVEMSMVVRDSTTDPAVRQLAYDVALGQQQQIGQMYGWLVGWGLPQTSAMPPMAWAQGSAGSGHDMSTMSATPTTATTGAAAMPGMATPADVKRLSSLRGVAAEREYLRLMIAHHRGGVAMAQAVLARTQDARVRQLAQTIVTGQTAEISAMQAMLAKRR